MVFRIDTHVHTSETSKCGRSSAAEMVAAYKAAGVDAIVISDHFVNGNSLCAPKAPWDMRMEQFLRGYHAACRAGKRLGVRTLLGWEWGHQCADYVTIGLDEGFLYDHPEIETMEPPAYCALVHACGGFVIRAHPFRQAAYMNGIKTAQYPEAVDAIEIINGGHVRINRPDFDALAKEQQEQYGKIATAGSDAHHVSEVWKTGMLLSCAVDSTQELAEALRAGKGVVMENAHYGS